MQPLQSYFQPADRIADIKPYFFASLNKKITALKEMNVDVIRIDIGSPDLPPADFIINQLIENAKNPNLHGYAPIGGPANFREAVSVYYKNRFNVELDPKTEVLGLVGSKEGLFHLSQVLLNPGDVALIPDPGYPVYESSARIAGAETYKIPLLRENNFLPVFSEIPEEVLKRAKLMWLNYPNNPTGAVASLKFFEEAVEFARQNHLIIAHDAPYADVCFDNYKAPSILEVDNAKEICIEFNSLSKTYNMAGWRLGMAVGNDQAIKYLNTYKSQMDTSQFLPIFKAGIAALTQDQTWLQARNMVYQERRDYVLQCLREVGFDAETPPAAIYVWAHLPARFSDSIQFCSDLLEQTGVSTTPGIVYGKHGEGYIRISLGSNTDQLKTAMQRLVEWCKSKEKNV